MRKFIKQQDKVQPGIHPGVYTRRIHRSVIFMLFSDLNYIDYISLDPLSFISSTSTTQIFCVEHRKIKIDES